MTEKVAIIGSGNWGSCIAKIVGSNVLGLLASEPDRWQATVNMWVYEEILPDGRKLSEVINEEHENIKYLKGHKLPENVIAVPDLLQAITDATMLIFVVPHQFVEGLCEKMIGKVSDRARAISLIKGLDTSSTGPNETSNEIDLISNKIAKLLSIDVSVLMGANLANDIAAERFSEATIGYNKTNLSTALEWKELFETPYFRIELIDDVWGVELCGALKNIVAVASGFVDGLYGEGQGNNSKAAVMRLGMDEMKRFCLLFDSATIKDETFWASCGLADLITSCYGGRNRKIGEIFVREGCVGTIEELEDRLLHGQKLQGPPTAVKVFHWLRSRGQEREFPLFSTVYRVCYEGRGIASFFGDICSGYSRHAGHGHGIPDES